MRITEAPAELAGPMRTDRWGPMRPCAAPRVAPDCAQGSPQPVRAPCVRVPSRPLRDAPRCGAGRRLCRGPAPAPPQPESLTGEPHLRLLSACRRLAPGFIVRVEAYFRGALDLPLTVTAHAVDQAAAAAVHT
jgi:hypothetical protein